LAQEATTSTVRQRIQVSLENLVFALGEAAGAERSSLFVVDEDRAELRLAVARPERGRRLDVRMSLEQGVAGFAREKGTPVRVEDPYTHPRFNPAVDATSGYRTRSILCIPVRDGSGRVAGLLELLNPVGRDHFTSEDEREACEYGREIAALLGACEKLS
jgi:adenylate cyclase